MYKKIEGTMNIKGNKVKIVDVKDELTSPFLIIRVIIDEPVSLGAGGFGGYLLKIRLSAFSSIYLSFNQRA